MTTTDVAVARVLPERPIDTLDAYVDSGGGRAVDAARRLGPDGVLEHLEAAGLRGRGGAGFPTSRKWATVRANASATYPTTVVVNAAEGEPGSLKDREILRRNPFAVVEGALVAATTLGARRVVVATKASFERERATVQAAIAAAVQAGWADGVEGGVDVVTFAGPSEYLYGEETGLLEALEGRPPFPRVAPPYRHGVEELGESGSPEPARVAMADGTDAPPTLVNNTETMAHVATIVTNGPAWFRELGTDASPGTVVVTITGDTRRHGVAEVPMGTPLRDVVEGVGGGARDGRRIVAALSGVANEVLGEDRLDTPLSYEAMTAVGSGLGAAGFIVFDDATDFAAVAHGISRFLAVESCGQCVPCKLDGLAIAEHLDRVRRNEADASDLVVIDERLTTVGDSARCALAGQHQRVVGSLVRRFADDLRGHVDGRVPAADEMVVAPVVEIGDDGLVRCDAAQATKQPDWTHDAVDSGRTPAERLATASPDARRGHAIEDPVPGAGEAGAAPPADVPPAERPSNRVPPEDVADDPEARLYSSAPIETDEGTVVVEQQNVGPGGEAGAGEWPDPDTPPQRPAPGAS